MGRRTMGVAAVLTTLALVGVAALGPAQEKGDFVLRVQWRWGEAPARGGRNSGVFVWVSGPDKIWPKGVEAQLFSGSAGDIWLVDNFMLRVDPERQDQKTK